MERIKELEQLISVYKQIYYKGLHELKVDDKIYYEISDDEFDILEDELRTLDPNNKVLEVVGTSTESKIKHSVPMKSIEKTKNIDDIIKLSKNGDLIVTYKMDGSSCSLKYTNGKFIKAGTRGNGEFGEDITKGINYIKFPKEVNKEISYVNGEVVITKDNFELLKKEMIKRNLQEPSSIRNIVAGLLHRKDNKDLCIYLDFIAFDYGII